MKKLLLISILLATPAVAKKPVFFEAVPPPSSPFTNHSFLYDDLYFQDSSTEELKEGELNKAVELNSAIINKDGAVVVTNMAQQQKAFVSPSKVYAVVGGSNSTTIIKEFVPVVVEKEVEKPSLKKLVDVSIAIIAIIGFSLLAAIAIYIEKDRKKTGY